MRPHKYKYGMLWWIFASFNYPISEGLKGHMTKNNP